MTDQNSEASGSSSDPLLLVVEDEVSVAETIRDLLTREGYRVVLQHTSSDALEWAREHEPNLALVDHNLPDFTGRGLVEKLREEGRGFPFICISGAGEASLIVEMMKLGAKDYLQKGPEFHTLLSAVVRQALEEVSREDRLLESERERRELEATLQRTRKLESLGELARGIAHDFNNLLSSIIGYTRLAMADLEEDSLTYANLREVYTAGTQARELVDQIGNFSRGLDTERVPLDLAKAVSECIDEFEKTAPGNITLERREPDHPLPLLANPVQIRRVVDHLLANAAQAMTSSGGTLRLLLEHLDPGEEGPRLSPLLPEGSRYAVWTVQDTGVGMSSEIMERIFDPFYTTRGLEGGRGMGLSAAHGIVRSMGGTIEVESQPGEGALFRVYFPQTPDVDRQSLGRFEEVERGDECILIVDDEVSIARLARQILERLGYTVTVALSGYDALEVFQSKISEFDLVLTDLRMPQMDGQELAKSIKEIRPDIPIVALTGSTHELAETNFASLGFNGGLTKPVSPADLGRFVRRVLDDTSKRGG